MSLVVQWAKRNEPVPSFYMYNIKEENMWNLLVKFHRFISYSGIRFPRSSFNLHVMVFNLICWKFHVEVLKSKISFFFSYILNEYNSVFFFFSFFNTVRSKIFGKIYILRLVYSRLYLTFNEHVISERMYWNVLHFNSSIFQWSLF